MLPQKRKSLKGPFKLPRIHEFFLVSQGKFVCPSQMRDKPVTQEALLRGNNISTTFSTPLKNLKRKDNEVRTKAIDF